MGILDRLVSIGDVEERIITADNGWLGPDPRMVTESTAGQKVTMTTAPTTSAVYASWRIISEAIATLPRDSMIRRDGIPKPFRPRPEWLDKPNLEMPWMDFMGQIMVSLLAVGNGYVAVAWGASGVLSLTVLDPRMVTPEKTERGRLVFDLNGTKIPALSGNNPLEVLHFKGMSLPGSLTGMSPIAFNAQAIGISLAAQEYGANFFGNDATPSGVLEVPAETKLSPTGQKSLRQAWNDLFGGAKNAKSVAVLTEGTRFRSIQIPPNEAQFLETRSFQVRDIARIYGIPPHLLSDTTGTTTWGSGMAEMNQMYITHTLRPWLERVESVFTRLLAAERLRAGQEQGTAKAFINLNEEALLRTSPDARWLRHRANVIAGIMTADEVRKEEGLEPLPDGLGALPWIPLASSVGEGGRDTDDDDEAPAESEGNDDDDEERD